MAINVKKNPMIMKKQFIAFLAIAAAAIAAAAQNLPRLHSEPVERAIAAFMDSAATYGLDIHSVMVLQGGNVKGETWRAPGAPDVPHIMNSVSKPFTATAVGFAATEGLLSLDDKVVSFFPEILPDTVSPNLAAMTVRDLLTMSCGQTRENFDIRRQDADWARLFLAEPVPEQPGTYFMYNSLGTYMLSAIVTKVTGQKVVDYLRPRLFDPLGIGPVRWDESPTGVNCGGWGAYLLTEDMAKFGQTFLDGGKYRGRQVIPAAWVAEASRLQVDSRPGGISDESYARRNPATDDWLQGYGYQMWRCRHNAFRADGAAGQYIIILPELDAVIVVTADLEDMRREINLIWQTILPALEN